MRCKFCNAKLKHGASVCPVCGEEHEPKQGGSIGKIIVATIVCVFLVVALVLVILFGSNVLTLEMFGFTENQEDTPPSGSVSYTAKDEASAIASAENIVAKVGTMELTNAELQIYYWLGFYDFVQQNYYYIGYYMDITQPLDQQFYSTQDNTTWQQMFLESALQIWHRYAAVSLLAEANGFTLSAEDLAYLDNLAQDAQSAALSNGYESVDEFLKVEMGPAATLEGYISYQKMYYYIMRYVDSIYDSLMPSPNEIEAYYTENEETFIAQGVSKDAGDVVDVRHILIIPEGGTPDESGNTVYSEDEYAACYQEAKAILDQWKAGDATQESFAALARAHSEDPGSATNGGLYSGVTQGYMVDEFDSWIFDESRQEGDTALVKTSFGYHIMYFVSRDEAWKETAISMLTAEKLSEQIETAMTTWPMETYYDQIVLGEATLITETN